MRKKINAPVNGDELLTIKETALVLKASESSMYSLFNDLSFPARKIPRIGWRVRRSDLYAYMDNLYKNEI